MQPKQPKAETQAMSEYGEPWSLIGEPGDCWIEDKGGGSIVEQSCDCSDAQICRLVQCTNALAGIPNPEAVRELIEAVREWTDVEKCVTDERIFKALESLSAPSTGAQQK